MVWATTPTAKYQSGGAKGKGAATSKLSWSQRRRQEVVDVSRHWAFPRIRRLAHFEPVLPSGVKLPNHKRSPSPPQTRSTTPSAWGDESHSARRAAQRKAKDDQIMNRQKRHTVMAGTSMQSYTLQTTLTSMFAANDTAGNGGDRPATVGDVPKTPSSTQGLSSTLQSSIEKSKTEVGSQHTGAQVKQAKIKAAKEATKEKILTYQVHSPKDVVSYISAGDVRFLSVEYLVNMSESWRVARCQDLPKEAFVEPQEAAWLYDRLGGLVIVSAPWLTKSHPDPQGFHFHSLQLYLRVHQRHFVSEVSTTHERLRDVGVFWDFASLLQPSQKTGERIPHEHNIFARGMRTVEYLYGGPMTVVVQLKLMPFAAYENMNRTPYDIRGWCYFEEITSSAMKSTFQQLNLAAVSEQLEERNCQWQLVASAAQAERKPPMHPEQFRQELMAKIFAVKEDCEILFAKYTEFFSHLSSSSLEISLPQQAHIPTARPWGTKEVDSLVRALPEFTSCMKLNLRGRPLGDIGAEKLAKVLPRMTALETLWLNNCDIGNKGISALAPAFLYLKELLDLKLHGSRFTVVGLRELTDVTFFPWNESREAASGWERSFLQLPKIEDVSLPLDLAKTSAAEVLDRLIRTRTVQFSRLMVSWL